MDQQSHVIPLRPNFLDSIVAVHGIGATPERAWCEKNSKIDWLKDETMLPSAIPEARILRFGYDSQWLGRDPVRTSIVAIANKLLAALEPLRKVSAPSVPRLAADLKMVAELSRSPSSFPRTFFRRSSSRKGENTSSIFVCMIVFINYSTGVDCIQVKIRRNVRSLESYQGDHIFRHTPRWLCNFHNARSF